MSKILVVDDEEKIRLIIKKYGEFEGHEIKIGNNGSLICRQLRINDNTKIQLKNIPIIIDQLMLFEIINIVGNDVIVRDSFIAQSNSIIFQLDNKYKMKIKTCDFRNKHVSVKTGKVNCDSGMF